MSISKVLDYSDTPKAVRKAIEILHGTIGERINEPVVHSYTFETQKDLDRCCVIKQIASKNAMKILGKYMRIPIAEFPLSHMIEADEFGTAIICIETGLRWFYVAKKEDVLTIDVPTIHFQSEHRVGCWECGDTEKPLLKCGQCRMAKYCSEACQRDHWPTHKTDCKKISQP